MDNLLYNDHCKKNLARNCGDELNIRVITYNIHSCVNTDGVVRPQKIAHVLSKIDADLIALQEVDAEKNGNKNLDQAKVLAEKLKMDYIFFPVENNGIHVFGLAIFSRFPFQEIHKDWLPNLYAKLKPRKRGVIRAMLQTPLGPLHFFNTHLSLFKLERRKQVRLLVSEKWLSAIPENEPIIFCGDLNAGPFSAVYRKLTRKLTDVQKAFNNPEFPKPTFHSKSPTFRIDHIFVSEHFKIIGVEVPKTSDVQLASDHLPLSAELMLSKTMGS
jgi:endonuclease/exonuclease/phosphatase family metal-dependent hydrolase